MVAEIEVRYPTSPAEMVAAFSDIKRLVRAGSTASSTKDDLRHDARSSNRCAAGAPVYMLESNPTVERIAS